MGSKADGMNYAPKGKSQPVVKPGEFIFAAVALNHGHIFGMCNGLIEAGAQLKYVYDPDEKKLDDFCKRYPGVIRAKSEEEILQDPAVHLVAGAAVTSERCALGVRVMEAGKDYFTDKAPLTTLEQLAIAKAKVASTGRKYMVYFSERLHVESAVFADQLVRDGAIGRVLQTIGMGPHRLGKASRPEWFFKREKYGGILIDIGSHQIEQFLYYTGAKDATVVSSRIANYNNPDVPEFDDFGDAMLTADNGANGYFRIDWFTPNGLSTWGDGRTFILGTEGYIEMRKYVNVATDANERLFLVNGDKEQQFECAGKFGFPFFGQLILDCLNRTETAMTQEHAFKAAELCVRAQMQAIKLA